MKKREFIEIDINVVGEEPEQLSGNAMLLSIKDSEKIGTVVAGKLGSNQVRVKLLASSVKGILSTIESPEDYMEIVLNGVIEGFKSHAKSQGASEEKIEELEELMMKTFDLEDVTKQQNQN